MTTNRFSLAIALLFGTMLTLPLAAKTESSDVLKNADLVSKGLASDDLDAAKAAATALSQSAKSAGNETIAEHAAELANSGSLADAREHFKAMSSEAAKLAEGSEQYHVMSCPMASATWVQTGEKVMNPYMGKKMQQCGSMMKKAGADQAGSATMACCPMG